MSRDLHQLAEAIRRESGIALGESRLPVLAAAVKRVAPDASAADLLATPMLGALIDAVTVNETFYFRHRFDLDAIDWHALRAHAAQTGRTEVRVWSAACASGEEAYTLAILACEAFATSQPPVSILGTDISSRALEQARHGRYGARSLAAIDAELRRRYFERDGGSHLVGSPVRSRVRFQRHNLTRDTGPPAGEAPFDLILCRNVLIYFDPGAVERTLAGLEAALVPGGTLILGSADRLCGAPPPTLARASRPRTARRPRATASRRRRPPQPSPTPAVTPSLRDALAAADAGRLDDAVAAAAAVLHRDPLDADANFVRGVAELARGDAVAAADALRRALYVDPGFALAAFKLGRAHDSLAQPVAARRAYAQAVAALARAPGGRPGLVEDADAAAVADACRARLATMEGAPR